MTTVSQAFINRLTKTAPIILDGAMGTELERRNVPISLPLWSTHALISHQKTVKQIHKDYIQAGADIITANTFRTNSRSFKRAGIQNMAKELTHRALILANEARQETITSRKIWIAGSIAPLEDCYRPDLVPPITELRKEHKEHAQNQVEGGVDLILIETMNKLIEAEVAIECALSYNVPVFVGFVIDRNLKLLSGESILDMVNFVEKYKPSGVCINCTSPDNITKALQFLSKNIDIPVGVYANIGFEDPMNGWQFTGNTSVKEYGQFAKEWVKYGAKIIGGCCGTSPEHIQQIAKSLNN